MRISGAAIVLTGLLLAPSAGALDVDDVACACTDGALSRGDVVSCVARLSLRLLDNGTLDRRGRAALLRDAVRGLLTPPPDCGAPGPGGSLEPLAFGAGAHLDSAFYPVGGTARVELQVWNHTAEPVRFHFATQGGRGCNWDVRVFDELGRVVILEPANCADAPTDQGVPPGETYVETVDVPLLALQAETGLPDGTPLPPGVYRVEAALVHEAMNPGFTLGAPPIRIE